MERIIVLRSAVLGDFIISSPALNLIREKNPDAKIYLFTIQSAHKKDRDVIKVYETKQEQPWLGFLHTRIVDEIIPMQSVGFIYLIKEMRPIVKRINPTKCYVLTDPLVSAKGNIAKYMLFKLLGANCNIYGWKDYVKSSKEKIKANAKIRCVNHTLSCLESVFEDSSIIDEKIRIKFPIFISEEGERCADGYWNSLNLNGKKTVVLSPGGIKPHKIWPVKNYIEIVRYLLQDTGTEIVLTGTRKDLEIGKFIEETVRSERIHNIIAQTDLQCLAAILKRADLLIGNDGGSMHIGDAVGCTVVAIMPGLELPESVEPWHNIKNALRAKVDCSPCYGFDNCADSTYKCMRNISVDAVKRKIDCCKEKQARHNGVIVKIDRSGRVPVLTICDEGDDNV